VLRVFKIEKWTKYVYLIIFVALFLFKPSFESTIDNSKLIIYVSFFFIASFIHLISQKGENWFRLDVLFLLGFAIVHFQWAIMIAFSNIEPDRFTFVLADSHYMNYGVWLSSIGIVSWLFGYSFFKTNAMNTEIIYHFNYTKLFWFTTGLFGLFILMAGSNYLSGGIYKGEGGSEAGAGISVYFRLLFSISILLLTAFVILNNVNFFKSSHFGFLLRIDKKYLILFALTILLFLGVGDRGGALQPVMAFLIIYGTLIRPIKLKEFILLVAAGALIMTLIGEGRSSGESENILVAGASKIDITSAYDLTSELARSVRALNKSLSDVPAYHDYFLGKLWLSDFLAVIPLGQNIYMQLSDASIYETASSKYLTYLMRGIYSNYGEGTTLIADIYLNFGLLGVISFMFFLGLFFKKIVNELNLQRNYYWTIAAVILASLAFYMGRDTLFHSFRPILWGVFLSYLLVSQEKEIE